MKIELCRADGGNNFAVHLTGTRSGQQIVVPLSQELSGRIEGMLRQEAIGSGLLLPAAPGEKRRFS